MAKFSPCGNYRFQLERTINTVSDRAILFIMSNPSTATAEVDDKTTEIICEIAKKWNYGKVYAGNIYPNCPHKTRSLPDDIKKENKKYIEEMIQSVHTVVYAWGSKGPRGNKEVEPEWLKEIMKGEPYCIGKSAKGIPKHAYQWGDWRKNIPDRPIPFHLP